MEKKMTDQKFINSKNKIYFFAGVVLVLIIAIAILLRPKSPPACGDTPYNNKVRNIKPFYEWATEAYTDNYDVLNDATIDSNDDIVITFTSFDSGSPDSYSPYNDPSQVYIAKFSKDGDLIWQTELTNKEGIKSTANSVGVDDEGNIYVIGGSDTSWGEPLIPFVSRGYISEFIAKVDTEGNLIWNTFIDIDNEVSFSTDSIAIDEYGNLYLVGEGTKTNSDPTLAKTFAHLIKIDPDGNIEWINNFGEFESFSQTTDYNKHDLLSDKNGGIYLASDVNSSWGNPISEFSGERDVSIAKFNYSGELEWNNFLGNKHTQSDFLDTQIDCFGNIYVAGESETTWGNPVHSFSGENDIFLAKLDNKGNLLWHTFLGGAEGEDSVGVGNIAIDLSAQPIIVGSSDSSWGDPLQSYASHNREGQYGTFVAQFDKDGGLLWNTFIDGGASNILLDSEHRFYLLSNQIYLYNDPVDYIDFGYDDNNVSIAKLNLDIFK